MSKKSLEKSTERLKEKCSTLAIGGRVHTVYNPLAYAWEPYAEYLARFASTPKITIFLGMNPGPWGMAQTGIPFGEIAAVKDWLKISAHVDKPKNEIPKRPITGFDCVRSEVSGRRVWGLMRKRFGTPESFFKDHFVANYCPLLFYDADAKNLTPDKLIKEDREKLFSICDTHIKEMIEILTPSYVVGFGKFAESRLDSIRKELPEEIRHTVSVIGVLHPSPANPRANKGWEEQAEKKLIDSGIWN